MKTFIFLGIRLTYPLSVAPIHENEQRLMNTRKVLGGGMWTSEQVKQWEKDLKAAEEKATEYLRKILK